jgi:hypothetical protein
MALSAADRERKDAALLMAIADATSRTKRDKIIKANPFSRTFHGRRFKNCANRKMTEPDGGVEQHTRRKYRLVIVIS